MREDYERFLRDLERIAQAIGDINVVGIEQGLADELGKVMGTIVRLKKSARFIGGRS